ncbi:type VII secretion system-associated protein [Saccharopolyspora rosea]|uniref:type VII secretion system-associated protein n=1 Tax=Saccharopolyspora rosea TaxID=524884 RepID=UPI0021DA20ED|nr:type VII secretion system-associated protein [Saccharopolyspora rosea]
MREEDWVAALTAGGAEAVPEDEPSADVPAADHGEPAADRGGSGSHGDRWVFLPDPAWPAEERGAPPLEAVVGGWPVAADGTTGAFVPNPDYAPSGPDSPTDPVDAVLRLLADDRADVAALAGALREAELGVAVDVDGNPVLAPSPDDVPCVLATTAPARRAAVHADAWEVVTAAELAGTLPAEGVDVLLNPGSRTATRLVAGAFRDAVLTTVDESTVE